MRKILSTVLAAAMFVASACATSVPALKATQHRAYHWIVMRNAETGAGCTAYAVSSHVLLTAEHCDVPDAQLYIDGSKTPQVVAEKVYDKHDHMLMRVPGATFKYTEIYDPSTYAAAVQGEHVYMYGSPALIPNQYREGVVTGTTVDPNDQLSPGSPLWIIQMAVIGGDSGSSIFSAKDGRLIGVLTYGIDGGKFAGVYALSFTAEQVKNIEK